MVATNAVGAGPVSAASAPATPATVPGAPLGATAVATKLGHGRPGELRRPRWSNGGAPVTGYTVTSAPGGYT